MLNCKNDCGQRDFVQSGDAGAQSGPLLRVSVSYCRHLCTSSYSQMSGADVLLSSQSFKVRVREASNHFLYSLHFGDTANRSEVKYNLGHYVCQFLLQLFENGDC